MGDKIAWMVEGDALIPKPGSTEETEARERENIHNKAIFDALNEAFDSYRPYGLKGPPLAWTNSKRVVSFKHNRKAGFKEIQEAVKEKVIKWGSTRAGAIKMLPEDEDEEDDANEREKLEALRMEKLELLFEGEVEEGEQLWLDYEYEET